MLQFMGSQSDTTERLNWTELNCFYISLDLPCEYCGLSVKMEICSLYYFVHGFSSSLWHLCDSVTLLYVAVIHSSFLLPSIPIYYSLNSHSTWDGHLGYSQFIHVLCNVCVWVSELPGHRHVLSLWLVWDRILKCDIINTRMITLTTLILRTLFPQNVPLSK